MKNTWNVLMLCLFGFAGGIFSDQFLRPALADTFEAGISRFFDSQNRVRIDLGVTSGQAMQDMYGPDGKLRIQFGTYDGSVRKSEKDLPSFTLYDNEGRLRLLFRLDGPNQGPLIIMKDKKQRNRVIMGLDLWGANEEPFLTIWDNEGKQQDVYGKFVMKPL